MTFLVSTIGSAMLCYAIPYTPESLPAKLGAFTLFSSIMGATLAPVALMAGILHSLISQPIHSFLNVH